MELWGQLWDGWGQLWDGWGQLRDSCGTAGDLGAPSRYYWIVPPRSLMQLRFVGNVALTH